MTPNAAEILNAALKLPESERLDLADEIAASVPFEDEELRQKWLAECRRRVAEAEADPSLRIPEDEARQLTDEFMAKLRANHDGRC